jgi:hypothetical protein
MREVVTWRYREATTKKKIIIINATMVDTSYKTRPFFFFFTYMFTERALETGVKRPWAQLLSA